MRRRNLLIGSLAALGFGGRPALAACEPAQSLQSRSPRWDMETLWAYRFHANGSSPRPMGYAQPVRVTAKTRWVTVDFINGDDKIRRNTAGLNAIQSAEMREDIARGLKAIGGKQAACDAAAYARFSDQSTFGANGVIKVELIPVTKASAVCVRRIERIDSGGVAFWDREIFLLRARA